MNRYLLLIPLLILSLSSHAMEFAGTVVSKTGDSLKIEFQSDWAPKVGDPVTISAEMAGRTLSAGTAEVTEVNDGFVMAKVLSGNPNIRMSAVITSTDPAPVNVDADALYQQGKELYMKEFDSEETMLDWGTKPKNPEAEDLAQAQSLIKMAAELGNAEAKHLMAATLAKNGNVFQDNPPLREWAEKAADAGILDAQFNYFSILLSGSYGATPDRERAKEYLLKAAQAGHIKAMVEATKWDSDMDAATKLDYLRRAAEAGNADGQYWLAFQLELGMNQNNPNSQEVTEVIRWYEAAAEQGRSLAMSKLADFYYNGGNITEAERALLILLNTYRPGERPPASTDLLNRITLKQIARDFPKARDWALKAYENGNRSWVIPQRLGMIYSHPESTIRDLPKAIEYYQQASEKGGAYSTVQLFKASLSGEGLNRDINEAFRYATLASEQDEFGTLGNVSLGYCHLYGVGTAVNTQKAYTLLADAMAKKNGLAMIYLGEMYWEGRGVEANEFISYEYFKMASEIIPGITLRDNSLEIMAMGYAGLARAYTYGKEIKKNNGNAIDNVYKAYRYNPNEPLALRCHGLFLLDIRGREFDAADYFRRALENGDAESGYLLGEMYRRGRGVKKHREMALFYHTEAAKLGHAEAQKMARKLD